MVEVTVHGIGIDARWSQPIVLLQEVAGRGRILPVWLAEVDAAAVLAAQSGEPSPRPDTHTLIGDVIRALGHRVTGVVITELRASVFHAELVIDDGRRVDSRASDALTLALRLGVGVEVTDAVFERAGVPPDAVVDAEGELPAPGPAADPTDTGVPVDEVDVERFRRLLDDASPSDFEQE